MEKKIQEEDFLKRKTNYRTNRKRKREKEDKKMTEDRDESLF